MADIFEKLERATKDQRAQAVKQGGGDIFDMVELEETGQLPQDSPARQNPGTVDAIDELNASLSGLQKFTIGLGRGLTNVARGLGLAEQEDPVTKRAFERMADDSVIPTVGQVVGEAAPFVAAAPLAGAGLTTSTAGRTLIPAAQSTAARILGTGALGAAEGSIISKGGGGDTTDILAGGAIGGALAGGIEAISPVIGRLGRALFQRLGKTPKGPLLTPDGTPTPEFQAALDQTGTRFEDLTEEAFTLVNREGVNPEQAARAARFQSQGIPATAGDITQDFAQQAKEQRLLNQAGIEAAEPLRQMKLQQSQAFTGKVDDLVNSLGVADDLGESVKTALTGRKELLQAEKNALYKQVAETAPEVANMPLFTGSISEAIPGQREMRRLSQIQGNQIPAVKDLLVEFGIDKTPESVEKFIKSGGEVVPLNIGNFEDFRQGLLRAARGDNTGATSVVTGPLQRALDAEAELIDDALKARGGDIAPTVLDTLKAARERVRTIKTEFSPQAITGRLINTKQDGVTPVIEASKVARELLKADSRGVASIENLQRTMASLRKAGKPGQKAIKNMQAAVVMNALEDSLKAVSNKTSGAQMFNPAQFSKSLENLGEKKLQEVFRGNEKALSRLMNLKATARDIVPAAAATPKGSAPVILDVLSRASSMPGLAAVRDTINFVVRAGADDRAVRKAMNSKPAFRRVLTNMETDFPSIAAAIGVSAALKDEQE
jgi:hypothetical protein